VVSLVVIAIGYFCEKKCPVLNICRYSMVKTIIVIYLAVAANEGHFLPLLP